jgi:hypothetical protein
LAEVGRGLQRSGHVAVHGLGGVGKTQLVARYLHQRRADYPAGVFWLRAERRAAWRATWPAWPGIWRCLSVTYPSRNGRSPRSFAGFASTTAGCWCSTTWSRRRRRRWDAGCPPVSPGHLLLTSRMPMWPVRLALKPCPGSRLSSSCCSAPARTTRRLPALSRRRWAACPWRSPRPPAIWRSPAVTWRATPSCYGPGWSS